MSVTAFAADQKLELAAPFTNNMILQRETAAPVWGFDAPGSLVTVEFAGQTKTAVADQNGDWMIKLNPLDVSQEERSFQPPPPPPLRSKGGFKALPPKASSSQPDPDGHLLISHLAPRRPRRPRKCLDFLTPNDTLFPIELVALAA